MSALLLDAAIPWATPAWIAATLAAYLAGLWLYRRSGLRMWALPVLSGTAIVLALLALTGTAYPVYAKATRALRWLAGPATIALAAGCIVTVAFSAGLARLMGGSVEMALSLAPKSATMPIAMAAAQRAGGIPSVAAMAVVVTGVLGGMLAVPIMRWLRIHDASVQAFTLGLTAHAIGVVRTLQTRPEAVAFAALAMSANGLATALAMAVLSRWF